MPNQIERRSLTLKDGSRVLYSIYRKLETVDRRIPLILCLHPGWSGLVPPPYYGGQFLTSLFVPGYIKPEAVIISPDCPAPAWNHPTSWQAIQELLDHLIDGFGVDPSRVALVGYSAGGWGAWYFIQQDSVRFSSVVMLATLPVIDPMERFEDNFLHCEEILSGRFDEWLNSVPDLPMLIIHSRDDEIFPYSQAERAFKALVESNRRVEFHTVEGIGHFEGEGYVSALKESVPWLVGTWLPNDPA